MILQKATASIVGGVDYEQTVLTISRAARLCYNVPMDMSAPLYEHETYIRKRMKAKHDSVLEHSSITALFEVDRGVTHEMVRHRLASFTQSSTRYCDYYNDRFGRQITCIIPVHVKIAAGSYVEDQSECRIVHIPENSIRPNSVQCTEEEYKWLCSLIHSGQTYMDLRGCGWTPEQARGVLPIQTKSAIVWTANIREWRHILNLRAVGTTGRPHPDMQHVMTILLQQMKQKYPIFFHDINLALNKNN